MRRLRLLPPASQLFHVSQCAFPSGSGLVAPGMAAAVMLRFTPDTMADAADTLIIDGDMSRLEVPLRAVRPPPRLSLPQQLHLGAVYKCNTMSVTHTLDCTGGSGQFSIVPADVWRAQTSSAALPSKSAIALMDDTASSTSESHNAAAFVQLGSGFAVSPACFAAPAGGQVDIHISFGASQAGVHLMFTGVCACLVSPAGMDCCLIVARSLKHCQGMPCTLVMHASSLATSSTCFLDAEQSV